MRLDLNSPLWHTFFIGGFPQCSLRRRRPWGAWGSCGMACSPQDPGLHSSLMMFVSAGIRSRVKELVQQRKLEWEKQQAHFLLVAAAPEGSPRALQRALEMQAFLKQCLPRSRLAAAIFRRDCSGELVHRCTFGFGLGAEVRPAEYGSAQASWYLHRQPGTGPLLRIGRPPAMRLPPRVSVPSLLRDGAVHSSIAPHASLRRILDKKLFEFEGLQEADEEVLKRSSEEIDGGSRLLGRATLLALHGFGDWPQASLVDSLVPCSKQINSATGAPLPPGASFASACGELRWCNSCEQIACAADRTVHPLLLVDALATVLEDGLLGERTEAGGGGRQPGQAATAAEDPP